MISSSQTMSLEERNARRLIAEGKSLDHVTAYLDSVGVKKKHPVVVQRDPAAPAPPPPMSRNKVGKKMDAFAMSAFQTLTFGFGDEAIGTLRGLITDQTVPQGIAEYQAQLAAAKAASPGMATAGSLVGAAVPALATGGVGAGAGLLGRAGASFGIGAATGAAQGMGDASGGLGARAQAGIMPGIVGGVLGGGSSLLGKAAGTVVKAVGSKSALFAKIPGVKTAEQQGTALFHRAVERDGLNLDDMIDRARLAADRGQPVTAADLGGENVRGLLAAVAAVPGRAKQSLTAGIGERQAGQGMRLLGYAQDKMKVGLQNVVALRERILSEAKDEAKPLYEAAYAKSVQIDGPLQQALDNSEFVKAYELGRNLAKIEDVDLPPLFQVMEDGSKVWAPSVPVQALDYMKRGLNKRIDAGLASPDGIDRTAGRALRNRLEDRVLKPVDAQVPEFGIARAYYKGEMEALEAMDLGEAFRKMTPDAVAAAYAPLSVVEKRMARTTYLGSLADVVGGNRAAAPDMAKALYGSPYDKQVVKILFGDKADDMLDAIETEKAFSQTWSKMGGSRSMPLGAEMEDMAEAAGGMLRASPGEAMRAVGRSAIGRAKTGWTEEVSDEIAKIFEVGLENPRALESKLLLLKKARRPATGIGPLPSLLGQAAGAIQ
jgi:hypothetical protein